MTSLGAGGSYAADVAVILTVDTAAWRARIGDLVAAHAAAHIGILPVVKGNGYGFGRTRLAGEVDRLGLVAYAVGTAHELAPVADDAEAPVQHVLTPIVSAPEVARLAATPGAVPMVGSLHHLRVLRDAGWHGAVVLKLASSMRRYGVDPDAFAPLADAVAASGLSIGAFALHLPLLGQPGVDDGDDGAEGPDRSRNLAEAHQWLERLPHDVTVHLSHLGLHELSSLATAHPSVRLVHRVGTALWHGPGKDGLHLGAEVVDVRPCRAGDTAGYRATTVAHDGHLVMVGAGTAHGVQALVGGQSPFHYGRRRLALVESPHMHTSMVLVPVGDPLPEPGELVDVQRPLTQTLVDRIVG